MKLRKNKHKHEQMTFYFIQRYKGNCVLRQSYGQSKFLGGGKFKTNVTMAGGREGQRRRETRQRTLQLINKSTKNYTVSMHLSSSGPSQCY